MSSVLNCALYAIWLSMQTTFTRGCVYSGSIHNNSNNCVLNCYDNGYLTGVVTSDVTTLSFDELKELMACPSIQTAINEYGSASCSSLSIWYGHPNVVAR
eukprot:1016702_1